MGVSLVWRAQVVSIATNVQIEVVHNKIDAVYNKSFHIFYA